jgi:hypothetical protein
MIKPAFRTTARSFLFASLLLGSWTLVLAQEPAGQTASPPADNTKVNERDRNQNEPTADQQKENRSDTLAKRLTERPEPMVRSHSNGCVCKRGFADVFAVDG